MCKLFREQQEESIGIKLSTELFLLKETSVCFIVKTHPVSYHVVNSTTILLRKLKRFQKKNFMISWKQVPPRFELGSLDSESRVLTITPWDPGQYTYEIRHNIITDVKPEKQIVTGMLFHCIEFNSKKTAEVMGSAAVFAMN